MTPASFLVLLPALIGLAGFGAMPAPEGRVLLAQNEVVMRIQLRPRHVPMLDWSERKGPKCIAVESIRGAMVSGRDGVDFLLPHRKRVRAKLADDCPALDFYDGFYVSPEEDERICARRDSIRSRVGGSCRIERFRELVPKLRE
jgi:hypothetical protein